MSDTVTLMRLPDQWGGIEPDDFGRLFEITIRGAMADADGNIVVKGQKHRRPIEPDADLTNEDELIKAAAVKVRTPEALARFDRAKPVEVVSRGD